MAEKRTCQWKSRFDESCRCSEERLQGSKCCIFHKEDKTDEELEVFKDKIRKKLESKDYNFRGFIFAESVDFKEEFVVSSFEGAVDFGEAQFKERVHFQKTKFKEEANFEGARFEDAFFGGAHFEDAEFMEAHFQEAFFGEAHFGKANFEGARFGRAFFAGALFRTTAYFIPHLVQNEISLEGAIIENISMTPLNLGKNAGIDFQNARLRNTDVRRKDIEGHIKQEKEGTYPEAKDVYLRLKNNFHTLGRYDDASWAFQKEKEMERRILFKHRSYLKWFGSMFLNLLYGYGEKPLNVVASAGVIILIFALLYMCFGVEQGSGDKLPTYNIVHEIYRGIRERNVLVRIQRIPQANARDYLYFSVVTFTTLGFGDIRPQQGWSRTAAAIEALTGVILSALFIFTFARRTGGR